MFQTLFFMFTVFSFMFFIVHVETALGETLELNLNSVRSDRCCVLVLWWQVYCDASSRYKERDL